MSSKKKKGRKYSRTELEEIKNSKIAEERIELIRELVQRASDGGAMSLAEKEHAYRIIRSSYNAETKEGMEIDKFPSLKDYHFKELYRHYHNDLEGKYGIYCAWGQLTEAQKKIDVAKLNEVYTSWKEVVEKVNHSEDLLNRVCAEARAELKELKKISEKEIMDYREFNEKEKSIILHSKYLYLTVKEFFEERDNKPVVAKYNGEEIEINEFSLVHIMFRHYAGVAKQFDTNKSFHFDIGMNYRVLPLVLKDILEAINASGLLAGEPIVFVPFRLRGNIYGIWTKEAEKSIKGKQVKYLRLQTYYPIQDQEELAKIHSERTEIFVNPVLSVFKKN